MAELTKNEVYLLTELKMLHKRAVRMQEQIQIVFAQLDMEITANPKDWKRRKEQK